MNNGLDIEEEVLFSYEEDNDITEEVLFKNPNEDILEYSEPVMPSLSDITEEVLFATDTLNESGVEELSVYDETENSDITEEVLFGSGVEELAVHGNDSSFVGEDLVFVEPVKPTYVEEEVLFTPTETLDLPLDEAVTDFTQAGDIYAEDLMLNDISIVDKKVYEDKNFAQKMLETDPIILERYNELKNIILGYKGIKSRISNNFDSFNMGRTQLFKLCTSGKSLKLYLNLEYDKVETRLKCKYAGDKKAYAGVPVFLRIKSPRAMRNAKYLIEQVVTRFELKPNKKFVPVDAIQMLKDHFDKKDN